MSSQFDFNIRVEGEHVFVLPLDENPLIYLAQTTGMSKFDMFYRWFEVTQNWVIRAKTNDFTFCH